MKGFTYNIQPHFIDIHYEVGGKIFDLHIEGAMEMNAINWQIDQIASDYCEVDCNVYTPEDDIRLAGLVYEYNKRIETLMMRQLMLVKGAEIRQAERTDLKYIPIKPKGGDAATA